MKEKEVEPQNALILRFQRLMEAFAKSDDERDFFLNTKEGFLVYVNLDKSEEELVALLETLKSKNDHFCMVPKLTFYETKKIMEGFVNEKIYDIDTKEKMLDIIQSKEARENFLEFLYDHHTELDKWQQYYQERSRVKIIEWLRQNHFHFVFEEDLDLPQSIIENLKRNLFTVKVPKELEVARKSLAVKAKSYYSSEALNPRPKRGRPPKQIAKLDIEPQGSSDIFLMVPAGVRPFLFISDAPLYSITSFSSKFDGKEDKRTNLDLSEAAAGTLQTKLSALRTLSSKWVDGDEPPLNDAKETKPKGTVEKESSKKKDTSDKKPAAKAKPKKAAPKAAAKTAKSSDKKAKAPAKKKPTTTKKPPLRSILKSKNK
jgi:hypothetical protein